MFLKGICDSEGCVKITNRRQSEVSIEIAFGKNESALLECKELLKRLGILSSRNRTRTSLVLMIYGFQNLTVFQNKVGFYIIRKKTKLEKGLRSFKDLRKYKTCPKLFYTILRELLKGRNQYKLEKEYNLAFGTIYHWKRGDTFPLRIKKDIILGKFPQDFKFLCSNFEFLENKFKNLELEKTHD